MASILGSVPVSGFVAPTDDTDVYPAHSEEWGKGGFRSVIDLTERDAITTQRRKEGMLVYVVGTSTTYQLQAGIDNVNWAIYSTGGGGATTASEVGLTNIIGTPSVDNIESMNSLVNTAGVVSGCDITDNVDGTVSVASGTVFLRSTADSLDDLFSVGIDASGIITLVDDSMNYIYADYNLGAPIWGVTTNQNDINCQDRCLAYILHRNGTVLHIVDDRQHGLDVSKKTRDVFRAFDYFIHADEGSVLSEPAPLTIGLTAGKFFYTVTELPHDPFDTSVAGIDYKNTFELHYRDGLGGWNNIVDTKVIDTTLYDDGTGAVVLANNKFGVSWVYVAHNTPSHLHVVMGQDVYATQTEATNASIPSEVPTVIAGLGSLVGFVTYEKSAIQFSNVLSAFVQSFTSSSPTTHNSLASLQGGGIDDYQHLTTVQVEDLTRLKDISIDRQEPTGFVRENPDYMGVIELCVDGTKIISVDNNGTKTIRTDGTFATGTAFEQPANALEIVMYPTTTFYRVYVNSIKYDITTLQKATFADIAQLQFAYHDVNGVLQTDTGFTEEYFLSTPITATLYYNPNAPVGLRDVNFGDERHGTAFTGLEHYIAHFTDGTRYMSGMALDGLLADGLTFTQIASGKASDEDIIMYPSTQTTLPAVYLEGVNWYKSTDDANIALLSGGVAQYNLNTNGTFSLASVTGNDAMIVFFVLTNNVEYPYVKMLSQTVYQDANAARAAINDAWSEINIDGLPSPEFLPIGALIVNASGELQELSDGSLYYDLRKAKLGGAGTSSSTVTSHIDLLDRDTINSHPGTAVSYDNTTSGLTAINVQEAIDEIKDLSSSTSSWTFTDQTLDYTAIAGQFVRIKGALTLMLPATPIDGDRVGVMDPTGIADTQTIIINGNGVTIYGQTQITMNIRWFAEIFQYTSDGWRLESTPVGDATVAGTVSVGTWV